jgi:hypothetical protein
MKLCELKEKPKDRPSEGSIVVKKFDGIIADKVDQHIDPFDVKIEYTIFPDEDVFHPYGEGWAKEKLYGGIEITKVLANEPIVVKQDDSDEVIETYPIGTDITTLNSWDDRFYDIFNREIEKNAS